MKHHGNLIITADNARDFTALTEVTGWVAIHARAHLPALTRVGKWLSINARAHLPALARVGEGLDIHAPASLPALTRAGGGLAIHAPATLHAPSLATLAGHPMPSPEIAAQRIRAVAGAVLRDPAALDMSDWHSCETVHSLAGWAIRQAGEEGARLEDEVGPAAAGAILLGLEAAHMFYTDNETALQWLKEKA